MNYAKDEMIRNKKQPQCSYGMVRRQGLPSRRSHDCQGDCMDKRSCEQYREKAKNADTAVA